MRLAQKKVLFGVAESLQGKKKKSHVYMGVYTINSKLLQIPYIPSFC